jgi:hypothetical protein
MRISRILFLVTALTGISHAADSVRVVALAG